MLEFDKPMGNFYEPHIWYAVTIAPDDHLQFPQKQDRMIKFVNLYNEKFLCYTANRVDYCFYVEISEPHSIYDPKDKRTSGVDGLGPRLHLHGKVRFNTTSSVRWWLLYGMGQLLVHAKVLVKPIDDMVEWDKYCMKQQHIVKHQPLENIFTMANQGKVK